MRRNKQIPYKKRKKSREEELRLHIVWLLTAVAALALLVVLAATGGGRETYVKKNAREAGGAADVHAGSVENATASGAADVQADGTSAPAAAEPTETPVPTAIPIDEQERVVTDVSGDWRLILVNPKHMLPDDFHVDTAVIGFSDNDDLRFDERAVDALDEMLYDCRAAGCDPVVRAGYRSQATQEYLYEEKIEEWMDEEGLSREEAEEVAATIVAYPGTSEHQLGLSADIADDAYPTLNSSQADSPTQQWLMAHCQEYGFILRFPYDKSELTGIIYEPWHYRYVGKEAAEEIMEHGICLEEYLADRTGDRPLSY